MSTDNSAHQDSHRSIIKSTSIISAGTLTSRILGFLRDIVLAKLFGTGLRADAFFVALKIPNMFRDLVGEGATSSAIVPVFNEYLVKKERQEFWQFVNAVMVLAMVVLSVLTLAGVLLSPLIVRLIAPGFMEDPYKLDLTIRLTKMMFPYLILIGMTAHSIALLYTFRSFMAPAFSPCLLNIAIIISAVVSAQTLKEPIYGLAVGVIVGGLLQLVVQIPALLRTGFYVRWPLKINHPGVFKIGRLMLPRVFGAGVYQLTVFIDTFCASLASIVGAGGISAIYYSNRIIQFPMGVFGVAIASAVLPSLSAHASQNNMAELKKTLVFTLENIIFVMFPFCVLLIILAEPVIRILFERGMFDRYSTMITYQALMFYAIGLVSFAGIKVMVTAFHALQDTKTPVKIAAICLVINAALNFILMYPLKVGGIALASSVAATVDFTILFIILNRRLGGLDEGLQSFISKTSLASLLTAAGAYIMWKWLPVTNDIVCLVVTGVASLAIYGISAYFLQLPQAHKIHRWFSELFIRK